MEFWGSLLRWGSYARLLGRAAFDGLFGAAFLGAVKRENDLEQVNQILKARKTPRLVPALSAAPGKSEELERIGV